VTRRRPRRLRDPDVLQAALDQIAADLTSGYIDETEAIERAYEAGCTPAAARARVDGWLARGAP
jgi:hypothetical protein